MQSLLECTNERRNTHTDKRVQLQKGATLVIYSSAPGRSRQAKCSWTRNLFFPSLLSFHEWHQLFWWESHMHRCTHMHKNKRWWSPGMAWWTEKKERHDGKKIRQTQRYHSFAFWDLVKVSLLCVCVRLKRRQSQSVKTPPPNSKRQYRICIFPTIQLPRLSASPLRSHAFFGHLSLTHIQTHSLRHTLDSWIDVFIHKRTHSENGCIYLFVYK